MTHQVLRRWWLTAMAGVGLALTACAAPPPDSWPGLAAQSQTVFVAYDTHVRAVDAASGKELWKFPPADGGTERFVAAPVTTAELLIFGSEGPANAHSGILFAVNLETHTQAWCLAFDSAGNQRAQCPLAVGSAAPGLFGITASTDTRIMGQLSVADGVVYVGLANGKVYAVKAADGSVLWHVAAQNSVWAAPVVAGDLVLVTSLDHFVYAFDREAGTLRWKQDLKAAMTGTPTVISDTLYVGTFAGKLHALSVADGALRWEYQADDWIWDGPTAVNGRLYFTDISGSVVALEAATGQLVWEAHPGGKLRAAPVSGPQFLYVGDRAGQLFALNPETGATAQTVTIKGELLTQPLIVNETLIAAVYNGDNLLAAYSLDGVTQRWAFKPTK